MFLNFQSHSVVTVERKEAALCRIRARIDDGLFSGEASLEVRLPALNIETASLSVTRDVLSPIRDFSEISQRLIGVRVGQGMTQIIRGIIGGPTGSERMTDMVLEAMEMLINALTVPELRKAAESGCARCRVEGDGPKVFLNDVVIGDEMTGTLAANPRLKDSCAAFKDI
jgi:hypothetical protein